MYMRVILLIIGLACGFRLFAQTNSERRVNDHLSTTHKKIEIERQKREAELQKEHNQIQVDPLAQPTKRKGFIERQPMPKREELIIEDHFDHQSTDPAQDIQKDISDNQEQKRQQEIEQKAFIEEFKRRARESGVDVDIDPKTLKAKPK